MATFKYGSLDALPKPEFRKELDQYWTPAYAVFELLKIEKFPQIIHEPGCGAGHISRALINKGYNVVSSDLREPSYYGMGGIDFLKKEGQVDSIITNPPYVDLNRWLKKTIDLTLVKSALLVKLSGLVSKGRYEILRWVHGLRIYAFTTPLDRWDWKENKWKRGSAFSHAWFVIDKYSTHIPQFTWIDVKNPEPKDII